MPTVPEAHMCSVRALSALGRMPKASAAIEAMWLWNAVRSGMTVPTTRPSRCRGRSPGSESKQALPASQMRSRYDARRTPNFETPAPTRATRLMAAPSGDGSSREDLPAIPVEVTPDDQPEDFRGAAPGQEEAGVAEIALHRVLGGQAIGGEDAGGLVGDAHGRLGGEELDHGGLPGHRPAPVDGPGRLIGHEGGRLQRGHDVGQLEGDGLVLHDRLTEGHPL